MALENSQNATRFIPQLGDLKPPVLLETLDTITGVYSHSFHLVWIVLFTKEVGMEKEELGGQCSERSV